MIVQHVCKHKGTIVTGKLDFPVKIGQYVKIYTKKQTTEARVIGILGNMSDSTDSANINDEVAILFRGLTITIQPGDTICSTGSNPSSDDKNHKANSSA